MKAYIQWLLQGVGLSALFLLSFRLMPHFTILAVGVVSTTVWIFMIAGILILIGTTRKTFFRDLRRAPHVVFYVVALIPVVILSQRTLGIGQEQANQRGTVATFIQEMLTAETSTAYFQAADGLAHFILDEELNPATTPCESGADCPARVHNGQVLVWLEEQIQTHQSYSESEQFLAYDTGFSVGSSMIEPIRQAFGASLVNQVASMTPQEALDWWPQEVPLANTSRVIIGNLAADSAFETAFTQGFHLALRRREVQIEYLPLPAPPLKDVVIPFGLSALVLLHLSRFLTRDQSSSPRQHKTSAPEQDAEKVIS